MIYEPKTLLLRVRYETLRWNLQQAHSKLNDLPAASVKIDEVKKSLATLQVEASKAATVLYEIGANVAHDGTLAVGQLGKARALVEDIRDSLPNTLKRLDSLREESFLVQAAQSFGQHVWMYLQERATLLETEISKVDTSNPASWSTLEALERQAMAEVFSEGVELLGGIALRDARLDAEICEFADDLIQSLSRTESYPRAIPGGISSMAIEFERIIRLRFPQWTVWALPFAAHELWRVSVRRQFKNILEKSVPLSERNLKDAALIKLCLGDAFATYMMGPAYPLAAITLLFNPADEDDDMRVQAALSMLHRMDASSRNAATDNYHTFADEMEAAWNAAKPQSTPMQERAIQTKEIADLVQTLFNALTNFKYAGFEMAQWKSLSNWVGQLLEGPPDNIDLKEEHDLRHALNAAWLLRIHKDWTKDKFNHVQALIKKVNARRPKRSASSGRGPLGVQR
jgi:hypothetical protein